MRALRHMLARGRAMLLLEGAGALIAVVAVMLAPGDASGTARVDLTRAAGTLGLSNSREGAAVLRAANMRPGEEASGSVRVTATGTLAATLTLRPDAAPAQDAASSALAGRLRLTVFEVTDVQRPVTVYAGPLAAMRPTELGRLDPGQRRDFLFVASVPDGGAADNALQGASLAAGFTWTATAAEAPPESDPAPAPAPPATGTAPTTTAPTGTAPTGTAPAAPGGQAATPASGGKRRCRARKVRIRIRTHGRRIRRVTVKVGHQRAHRVRPRHQRITVKVRSRKRTRIRVEVELARARHRMARRGGHGGYVAVRSGRYVTIRRSARGRC